MPCLIRSAARPPTRATLPMLAVLTWALIAGCGSDSPTDTDPPNGAPPPNGEVALTEVAAGFDRPTGLASVSGDARLFVTEQSGRIRIIEGGEIRDPPFLDLSDQTTTEVERGLLGLAFHPDYASNGRFFVNHTDLQGQTRIVEYRVSADDPNVADPTSAALLRMIEQPAPNHNGGDLEFGPDGMLYVSTGDGGGANDEHGNGQDVTTLLGGLLRLDVSAPGEARIPPDNPFADSPEEGAEELWAWGLRNPWRISFDHESDLLYIADVGQNRWEEVNVVPADAPGLNYGWPIMEGPECLNPGCAPPDDLVDPVVSYSIDGSGPCAIIGGGVYGAGRIPDAEGHYFYSDFCAGFLRSFRFEGGEAVDETEWDVDVGDQVSSMGRDAEGEIYLLTRGGQVLRLDPGEGE